MSQHRTKGGKAANPLHKPWTKDAGAKNARPAANKAHRAAADKTPPVKAVRTVQDDEGKVYGENACRVLFSQRPDALIRLYVSAPMAAKFADVMKYLAAAKKAYHIVDDTELEKVAGSSHHGGVVLLVKRKPQQSLAAYLQQKGRKRDCLLALDGVGNPHKRGRPIYDFWVG
ncbi:hypothetical protein MN202_00175 [Rheinheimera muenzenbergensis]|uniref:RNA 2-O ribose methyltransferase substrate binding domain-containing protein n=1 Tax=Rheinheimera muenzenbergensis TaxID=1193628 RepID=A0ABU8C1T5_9GAMM